MRSTAYWREFKLHALDTGLVRELPLYEVLEVLSREPILIPIRGKERTKKGPWREVSGEALYTPGEVLHAEWRPALEWEQEEWQLLSEEELRELGVFKEQDHFSIKIVKRVRNLPAMIRQRGLHIPGSMVARQRGSFTIPGEVLRLTNVAERLIAITPHQERDRESTEELLQLALELAGAKSKFRLLALQEISLAQQGTPWEAGARISRAASYMLQERARSYEIALKNLELADKLLALMRDIETKFRSCYTRLGQLAQKLASHPDPQQVLDIAREAGGIYLNLVKEVPGFNPYYGRLHAPKFRSLSRAVEHGMQNEPGTLQNNITGAAAILERVAQRGRPTQAEVARQKAAVG